MSLYNAAIRILTDEVRVLTLLPIVNFSHLLWKSDSSSELVLGGTIVSVLFSAAMFNLVSYADSGELLGGDDQSGFGAVIALVVTLIGWVLVFGGSIYKLLARVPADFGATVLSILSLFLISLFITHIGLNAVGVYDIE